MSKNVKPLRIAGVGYCVPDTVITNDDLTKLYETSDEWIYTRTGIKERRVVSGNESAVDLGVKAAENALNKSGFKAEDIDCVIAAASAPPPEIRPRPGRWLRSADPAPDRGTAPRHSSPARRSGCPAASRIRR